MDRRGAHVRDRREPCPQREHAADHAKIRMGPTLERADAFMGVKRFHAVRKAEIDLAAVYDRDIIGGPAHWLRPPGDTVGFRRNCFRDGDPGAVAEAALGVGGEHGDLRCGNAGEGDCADKGGGECEFFHWLLPDL